MPSIKLRSLQFDQPKFRKLVDLHIPIAERITVIAGHNGLGKSTILGLCANGSGLRDSTYQSYANRTFVANLNEIVHLDYAKEFEEVKETGDPLPSPVLEYDVDGTTLLKRCALTGRTDRREVRVVPRNDPHGPMILPDGGTRVGPDAKVPLPTLYLGMTRMLPIGESNPNWVKSAADDDIEAEDADFITTFINDVIGLGNKGAIGITTQSIRGTRKTAKHPKYGHSAKCISLGQDSLSAIATSLASFKKLKREWADYPGGLLVVDEIDAGFHPYAQRKLVQALGNAARKLDLQIIVTTHSLSLIEAVHPDANPVGPKGKYVDAVVYLADSKQPRVAADYTLADIQNDMNLLPPVVGTRAKAKVLKVYLEDAEAHLIFKRLINTALKRRVRREAGVVLKPIPLSVGCGNLQGLMKHDPYFKTVLIAVDADATIKGPSKNIVKLPGGEDAKGKGRSPEWTLYNFISLMVNDVNAYPATVAALAELKVTRDHLEQHLLDGETNIDKRESAKSWMLARLEKLEKWHIVESWLSEHAAKVQTFEEDLLQAAKATAKLL